MKPFLKLFSIGLVIAFFLLSSKSQAQSYQVEITLHSNNQSVASIEIRPPAIPVFEAEYVIPFQSSLSEPNLQLTDYLTDIKATNSEDQALSINLFKGKKLIIQEAQELEKITYTISRSLESGLLADTSKNAFLLYPQFFIGYVNNLLEAPFDLTIKHDKSIFTTYPDIQKIDAETDFLKAANYAELLEQPIFYGPLDTLTFEYEGIKTHLSLFSENGLQSAQIVNKTLQPIIQDLKNTLGDLALPEYHFLFYFTKPKETEQDQHFGGLFHNRTTVFILPEKENRWAQIPDIQRLVSHELMHTLCPYHLHSEQLSNLQYTKEMSQHLWLFEGVTEYLSLKMLLQNGRYSEKQFWKEIKQKIVIDSRFPKYSMTEASANLYNAKFRNLFPNFYHRGALAAMIMDIRILKSSKGEKDLMSVIQDLAHQYGPDEAFEEGKLFEELMALGDPDWKFIFDKHIIGQKPIPINAYLEKLGQSFYQEYQEKRGTYGYFQIKPTGPSELFFTKVRRNEFGLEEGDRLLEINGQPMTYQKYLTWKDDLLKPSPGFLMRIKIQRDTEEIDMQARAIVYERILNNVIRPLPQPTREQKSLYRIFLDTP